ncbi:hypothetical protein M406DRAFT_33935 [Cryphonectria parasitica EP155]|uniref:DNA ligase n=1 Tax=Cryphonectria parasitica (strain ATCC 38755 / EP155) TaxID=660469 RepID=A0A9P4YB17_CRYP1|nr:uncharacterized protein M406DRAFT_33935 [Cryphonectria parasitica EP155]KAF3770319.1 hypothetical protein M406DRAFT_33935 [Cryphonectria parasitica EP155]
MYANGAQSLEEFDAQYPNRPHNHSPTLFFSELTTSLFNSLTNPPATGHAAKLRRPGTKTSDTEQRRHTIERFFSHWRNEVGDDVYPVMRLILPTQDRERGVFRLKEQTIAKLLIKLMKISSRSEDGHSLLNWKVPGKSASSRLAGDFAGRCFEALDKRPLRTDPGDMRIAEVNELLDRLAAAGGESDQLPIFEEFYRRMNPEEVKWLIRIILKQMKIGATERTFLNLWHDDGERLFSVSSSLRHVCWELWSPKIKLEEDKANLNLMQCFQPQLASYSVAVSFEKMVEKLRLPSEDPEFMIEEKLDGERMQLHMMEDDTVPGGYRFGFWSRKAKNYTFLYGESFGDESAALTRHLKGAFDDGVLSCILDGEMIAWDATMQKMLAFGTLKTAALNMQNNPFDKQGWRPLFRAFDCLYLNGHDLTKKPLHARRKALEGYTNKSGNQIPGVIQKQVPGRFEIHPYKLTKSPGDIEPMLRKIVENSSEGLVIKNPHAVYRLNERPVSWIKVKPEYMTEYGENLDCVIIGGYYGSGRRGNMKSSFLCGLRARRADIDAGIAGPETFYSFFKVGGGLTAQDYALIEHRTEGKWRPWNPKAASQYVELAGGDRYFERPDVWIRPSDSIVIEVKAASAEKTASFRVGQTLRFPRFRNIRDDKKWDDGALDMDGWEELESKVEEETKTKKEMEIENRRHTAKRQNRGITVPGEAEFIANVAAKSKLFVGMKFYVPSNVANPKMTKTQLEVVIREHGGTVVQNPARVREGDAVPLADRIDAPRVAAVKKFEGVSIIRPKWVLDSIENDYLLPYETDHLLVATEDMLALAAQNSDQYNDSYCRDVQLEELRSIFAQMSEDGRRPAASHFNKEAFYDQLEAQGHELPRSRGYVFRRCRIHLVAVDGVSELTMARLRSYVSFGNGQVAEELDDEVTHVVIVVGQGDVEDERLLAADVRKQISKRKKLKIPRVVTEGWVGECWKEETRVSEEEYAPV